MCVICDFTDTARVGDGKYARGVVCAASDDVFAGGRPCEVVHLATGDSVDRHHVNNSFDDRRRGRTESRSGLAKIPYRVPFPLGHDPIRSSVASRLWSK